MSAVALTAEDILVAAETALRRFGPDKATVVDVARALGVSHGSVYRHFASKAALRDAVTQRWLEGISLPLREIAQQSTPAPQRLRQWFDTLRELQRTKATDDPELFATYRAIVIDSRDVVTEHADQLTDQIAHIVRDGIASGDFSQADVDTTASGIFSATLRFHQPLHAGEWGTQENNAAFQALWRLLMRALRP